MAHNLVDVTLLEATAIVFWATVGLLAAVHQAFRSTADMNLGAAEVDEYSMAGRSGGRSRAPGGAGARRGA
jgi:hypothetical protein